jgi:hypothetical protein
MRLLKLFTLLFLSFSFYTTTQAQNSGPRLFLDGPGIFFTAPDVPEISNLLGLGTDLAFNVGTHNAVFRVGGGSTFTVNPQSNDLLNTLLTTPFVKAEIGAGVYRSNGNKCARTHRPAFTYMAKAGIRNDFLLSKNRPEGSDKTNLDYSLGAEFSYFYIRDIIRNTEVFAHANYYLISQNVAAEIGFRTFFNLRGRRD